MHPRDINTDARCSVREMTLIERIDAQINKRARERAQLTELKQAIQDNPSAARVAEACFNTGLGVQF